MRLQQVTSIRFNDARSMSVTSYFPIVVISLLLAVLFHELAGPVVAALVLLVSLFVLMRIRSAILVSVQGSGGGIEFQTIGGARSFALEEIKACSVHGLAPAFSLVIVIWLADRVSPVVLFAGARSTSAGSYGDTIAQLRGIVPGTPGEP